MKYIGMISHELNDRNKEHLRDLKYNQPTIDMSRLYRKQNIQVIFEDAKIICLLKKYHELIIIRESMEIITKENT